MPGLGPLEPDSYPLSKEALSDHVEKIALFIELKKDGDTEQAASKRAFMCRASGLCINK